MFYPLARPAAAAALALLAVPTLSWADETSGNETIEQIVVVAHKDERSVRDVAANVTVLSRGELNAHLATLVD